MKILLVDDERSVHSIVGRIARDKGHELISAFDGAEALLSFEVNQPDLVILDVMLPKLDGFQTCRKLRELGAIVPVIFLSAKGDIVDKGVGFDAGGDDYMVKPFSAEELSMRIEAHLRQHKRTLDTAREDTVEFDGLSVDVQRRKVTKRGAAVDLSPKEFEVLALLAVNKGDVLTRDQLTVQVWGESYAGETLGIAVYIRRIREKIEDNPSKPHYIQTVWREGYRFGD